MKRIYLTCATARLIEQQVSAYEDMRDEKGKPVRDPKERRQWNRIADDFLDAAGACEAGVKSLQDEGTAWGKAILAERSLVLEDLTADWHKNGVSTDSASQAIEAVRSAFQMQIDSKEAELSSRMQELEDGPVGKASCEVDVDEEQLKFLKKTWDELDLNTNRRTRRMVNLVTDALENAVDLTKDGDKYVPKSRKPTLVEKEEAS